MLSGRVVPDVDEVDPPGGRDQTSSHEQAAQAPPGGRRSQRRKTLERRLPIVLSALILLGYIAYGINLQLDHSRQRAEIVAKVESKGGQVLDLMWGNGYRAASGWSVGHVDVLFEGQRSRCSLDGLQRNPAVFECDPVTIHRRPAHGFCTCR